HPTVWKIKCLLLFWGPAQDRRHINKISFYGHFLKTPRYVESSVNMSRLHLRLPSIAAAANRDDVLNFNVARPDFETVSKCSASTQRTLQRSNTLRTQFIDLLLSREHISATFLFFESFDD